MSLFDKVKRIPNGISAISDWIGDGGIPVNQGEAQGRANICLRCPANKIQFGFIEAVAAAIKKTVKIKAHLGLRTHGEKKLGTCEECLCPLKLKVWVPIEVVRRHMMEGEEEKLFSRNAECWQVNEK